MTEINIFGHEYFMREALRQAKMAYDEGEVPVGAVVVSNNKIIGKGYNQTERLKDVTAHAEVLAITAASSYLGAKYLSDCTLYVTLEPCVMCAGALHWAQIDKVVFGASDPKKGFLKIKDSILHPKTEILSGIMELECKTLVDTFFRELRS
jgi:tRNA(adenine34) deaminase